MFAHACMQCHLAVAFTDDPGGSQVVAQRQEGGALARSRQRLHRVSEILMTSLSTLRLSRWRAFSSVFH